jgi:CBS domain-containing protein
VKASSLLVREVALPKLFYCTATDNIHLALQIMGAQKVRRLPVLDAQGALEGILCLDDIVAYAEEKGVDLTYTDVVETLKAICEHAIGAGALAVAR